MKQQSIAAIKRYRTARLAKAATKALYYNSRGQRQKFINTLGDAMIELGGVYIKFLQGVLLQSDSMKIWQHPDKLKIFERLESEPLNIQSVIESELGQERAKHIAQIQPEPFAAGSFGQVYYAVHQNGQPVIVKVLRPLIKETLKFDLKLLNRFSKTINKALVPNLSMDLTSGYKDFAAATLRETDYKAEADFGDELYHAYRDNPKLVIPKTYTELCTDNIIVQEYIDGVSVAYLVGLVQQGVDPEAWVKEHLGSDLKQQLTTYSYEMTYGCFTLPRIQGDPHPGNVKLLPNNKVAMIDFGISAATTHDKAAYLGLIKEYQKLNQGKLDVAGLFGGTMRYFGSSLYSALQKLGNVFAADVNLNQELSKFIESNFMELSGGESLESIARSPRAVTLLNRMVNQNNRYGFVMDMKSTDVLRAAHSAITLLDSLGMYQKVVPEVYKRVIAEVEVNFPQLAAEPQPTISVGKAIDVVTGWLERVADRDPGLFRSLMQKLQLKKVQERLANK